MPHSTNTYIEAYQPLTALEAVELAIQVIDEELAAQARLIDEDDQ